MVALSSVVGFTLSILADRTVGFLSDGRDLVFERFSRVRYRTPEFTVESRINNLGFRDRDFAVRKTRRFRIVAIGDSYTYGWGVPVEDAWPKVLERRLLARGYDVEVANLGQPGASPADYSKIALRAIPVLQPDLVIVGLLQGDDLAQAYHEKVGVVERAKRLVRRLYPHVLEAVRGSPGHGTVELTATWKGQAGEMLARFSPEARARFGSIDPEVRQRFEAGTLNPALIDLAVRLPDYFRMPLELESPETRRAVVALSSELRRIRAASDRARARALVVSVPLGAYVSPRSLASYRRTGFSVDTGMLRTSGMDDAAREAAAGAGLPFHEVTARFREAADTPPRYFELDGHFNPAGGELFAGAVEPIVTTALDELGELPQDD